MGRISVFIVFILIAFSGCKSKKFVFENNEFERLRHREVLNRISEEKLNFKNVFFKRSLVKMDSDNGAQSFRSNIFVNPDSFIRVSVLAPMGIEVARISFEKNEVLIIDRMNRLVIYTDYDEVYRKFGAHLNFEMLENILLDKAFSYHSPDGVHLRDYHFTLDENQYLLSSIKEKQYERLLDKDPFKELVYQNIWIDPSIFLMRRTFLSLAENDIVLDIKYEEFTKQDTGFYFPEKINIVGSNKNNKEIKVTVSHSSIRFNDDNGISFKIPDKYEKIYR